MMVDEKAGDYILPPDIEEVMEKDTRRPMSNYYEREMEFEK